MDSFICQNQKTARLAGVLYLTACLTAAYGGDYVSSQLIDTSNPALSATQLLSGEGFFRSGILLHLVSVMSFALMVLLLYRLFSAVNRHWSRLMVFPVLVQVPVFLLMEVVHLSMLSLLKTERLSSFSLLQRQELSLFLQRVFANGIGAAQIFWGLWLIPLAVLIFRSAFLPRLFGFLLLVNAAGYLVDGVSFVLLQREQFLLVRAVVKYTFLVGIAPTMLWMLIKGVRHYGNEKKVDLVL